MKILMGEIENYTFDFIRIYPIWKIHVLKDFLILYYTVHKYKCIVLYEWLLDLLELDYPTFTIA